MTGYSRLATDACRQRRYAIWALLPALFLMLLLVSPLRAAEHGQHHGQAAQEAETPAPDDAMPGMEAMRERMRQARATEDPAERRRLLGEHMQMMEQRMNAMGRMSGKNGMGRMAGDSAMPGRGGMMTEGKEPGSGHAGHGGGDMSSMAAGMHEHHRMMHHMMEHMASMHGAGQPCPGAGQDAGSGMHDMMQRQGMMQEMMQQMLMQQRMMMEMMPDSQ